MHQLIIVLLWLFFTLSRWPMSSNGCQIIGANAGF
jgi:hypothetical protein